VSPEHNPGEPEFGEHADQAPHNPGEPEFVEADQGGDAAQEAGGAADLPAGDDESEKPAAS